MRIKEVADLVGISVRTLHHYDEIGLLHPSDTTEAGYRIYSDKELDRLQQILFFRELGFPLKKIKEIIDSPSFNQNEALELHRKMLIEKRDRLTRMIRTVEKTIQHHKGEIVMSKKEQFEGFDFSQNPYEQEARERWGNEAVDKSKDKMGRMSKQQLTDFQEEFNDIYRKLAEVRHESAHSNIAQERIELWYNALNKIGDYSLEAFQGLGQMYVEDERFTRNIDKFGEGLSVFMRDAMRIYAERNK
ncbi:MerR family transcriptional regulator [Oceanobacillus piezotolerans]|uniref:MerR family transcriptional regulator n=1 Tax=Oceanobacillus piezotolerans TaxID=2448030 RepID=A0A498D7I3_9BACI|nr:MerR family transcriptional regulator [Oceanobacillus piezotolerans]RLL42014.1 MerR family transcriptional regulator [Oceanobacillus piezotolerans]